MTNKQYEDVSRPFSRWQRFLIALATHIGFPLIYLLGRSLRWTVVGWEHWETVAAAGTTPILTFWHNVLMPGTWHYRGRGIMVMTSQNFDGEYIARIIEKFGYVPARGSSSQGGMKALHEMADYLAKRRRPVAFSVDGPRGPRYVAKIGPVLLAQKTGHPILCFHIALQRRIQLSSWDHFCIPIPFTRAVLHVGPPLYVPRDARRAQVLAAHAEMQRQLDRLRDEAESTWRPSPPSG